MKNTSLKHFILSLCLATIALSCVDEYKIPPSLSAKHKQELVVQGRISGGGESVFNLSYTTPLNQDSTENIAHARITVIGSNGYESETAVYDEEQQEYRINTRNLQPDEHYAVKIELDGETYQSDFQPMHVSPEIDNITYKEREDGISIHVTTHNDTDSGKAYMWTYEENWEFHSSIDIVGIGGIVLYNSYVFQLEGKNPYLYCWGHQKSRNINIYSTEALGENKVMEHELLRIPIDDIRISYIYSILVKQWILSNEAYDYFRQMKLYTEEANGLFTPIPAEVRGNISCISNPEIRVHGFVSASTITEKRIFIYESDFLKLSSEYENCFWMDPAGEGEGWESAWRDRVNMGVGVIHTIDGVLDLNSTYYQKECFDCREVKGSTKKRPYFWPNNHE